MIIKLNEKKECEFHYTWKEIFVLFIKKKLILPENVLDNFTTILINIKHDIIKMNEKEEKAKESK